jgi:hypothetical protein
MVKSLKSNDTSSFSEAVISLQASLASREADVERLKREVEDTRVCARREQRLILSAWYQLGLQLSTQQNNNEGEPNSWLRAQRRKQRRQLI